MAAKSNNVATELTRAQAVELMLNMQPVKSEATESNRLARFIGNRIAGLGDGIAAVGAGVSAARANYAVAYETERLRQAERSADRLLQLEATRKRLGLM